MKFSKITANLITKVDTKDYYGFALNGALNKYCLDKVLSKKKLKI